MTELEKDRSKSVWEDVVLPTFSSLHNNLRADVCVVGGGIAGVSIAYQLGKRGHKVILLEGARLGSGQTGRTTAHLTYQPEDQLKNLIKQHDMQTLSLFMQAHRQAIDVMEDTVFQENIGCDFKRTSSYLFLGNHDTHETLTEEVKLAKDLNVELQFMSHVPGFPNLGPAVHYPYQGKFHPLKYMAGLIRTLHDLDVAIFENSHVKEFKTYSQGTKVITNEGYEVEASYLVVATDSPVNNRFYIHTKQAAYRTYVVGLKINKTIEIPLLCDTGDPYHYIRTQGDLLLVGGEDHRTGQPTDGDPFARLEHWARVRFPWLGEVNYRWSGQVFEPTDEMGFIGRNPGIGQNVFIATGSSGMGMTHGTIASLLIPDLIEGKENSWEKIFDPSRVNLKGAKEFVKENSNIALQYTDWIRPTDLKDQQELAPDEGGILREGLHPTCIYHTSGDEFEKKSAVCTHLGGIVHWNDIEKTWDCPCHGSRFNTHGEVIEGPALNNLAEK